MALLQKIKKKLGFGGGASDSDGGETAVTVEREPDEADESVSTESDAGAVEPDESPVETDAGDEASGDAGGGVDDAETVDDGDAEATDTNEAGTDDGDAEATDTNEAGTDDDEAETDDDAEATDVDDDGTPVDQIKGIGPAYAERLGEIGVYTVEDLAGASATAIDEETGVGEGRATTWIERAEAF